MSELTRPEPKTRAIERLRHRYAALRERWIGARLGPEVQSSAVVTVPPVGSNMLNGRFIRAIVPLGLAFATVVAALGMLWGWQVWSQRATQPIDDLLPLLTVEDPADVEGSPTTEPTSGQTARQPLEDQSASPGGDLNPVGASNPAEEPRTAIVHVSGAVNKPGIVHLDPGGRVFEAVELAGGVLPSADLDRVNLAAVMVDGQRIHILKRGESADPLPGDLLPSSNFVGTESGDTILIDINQASSIELEALPGVGPTIAAEIVRTREERGPFLDVDELLEVAGIGESKLERLGPYILVGP